MWEKRRKLYHKRLKIDVWLARETIWISKWKKTVGNGENCVGTMHHLRLFSLLVNLYILHLSIWFLYYFDWVKNFVDLFFLDKIEEKKEKNTEVKVFLKIFSQYSFIMFRLFIHFVAKTYCGLWIEKESFKSIKILFVEQMEIEAVNWNRLRITKQYLREVIALNRRKNEQLKAFVMI